MIWVPHAPDSASRRSSQQFENHPCPSEEWVDRATLPRQLGCLQNIVHQWTAVTYALLVPTAEERCTIRTPRRWPDVLHSHLPCLL